MSITLVSLAGVFLMKKIFMLIAALMLIATFQTNGLTGMVSDKEVEYRYYNDNFFNKFLSTGKGEYELVTDSPWKAQVEKLRAANVRGETMSFTGDESDFEALINKLNLKKTIYQNSSDAKTVYGYSRKLRGYVYVDGEKVNIQIVLKDGQVIAGTPVIFGSY